LTALAGWSQYRPRHLFNAFELAGTDSEVAHWPVILQ